MSDDASRKDKRIDRKEARPQHEPRCEHISYTTSKQLFDFLMSDAKLG